MKFKIYQQVIYVPTGKLGLIVATKEESWKRGIDPFNRKEIFTSLGKDYIISLYKVDEVSGSEFFEGEIHVFEDELEFVE
mgnify:CR=1 FL=1